MDAEAAALVRCEVTQGGKLLAGGGDEVVIIGVPEDGGIVVACGDDVLAIGTEGGICHPIVVAGNGADGLAG